VKLSCTKENLLRGLSITSHLSTKTIHLPILQHVLLRAEGTQLELISTNLETAVRCVVRGKIEESGEFTVPAKLFYDYVSLLPNERIDIEQIDSFIYVSCGSTKTKINGIGASEFPLIPATETTTKYEVESKNIQSALSQVLFAVASTESRPEISGVSMMFNDLAHTGDLLSFAATDSYRLAERVVEMISSSSKTQKNTIVPSKTLGELSRIMGVLKDDVEAPETLQIMVADNQIVFRAGAVELTSRTIEGSYPDYHQIIPKEFVTTASVKSDDLVQAVKAASLFSRTGINDIAVFLNSEKQCVEIKSTDAQKGENVSVSKAEIKGIDQNIVLNYRYVLDGITAVSAETVDINIIDGSNPCLISATGEKKPEYRYIVMPIKQ